MKAVTATQAKQEMIQLCHSALDSGTLRVELLKRLQKVVPFDYAYFSNTDPATLFITNSVLAEEPPSWLMSVFLENEFLQDDFIKFSDMIKTHQTVGVLSQVTRDELHLSQRYKDMLLPLAMEDELRATFVTDNTCWGTLCLHRGQSDFKYSPAEADFVAQLAPHIADGLRKALLLDIAISGSVPDGPGVLILTDDLSIVAMTATAEYWLGELSETQGGDRQVLPLPIRSVISAFKAIEGGIVSHYPPKIRLRTRSGHWLIVYASRLKYADHQAQFTVIFELAQPIDIAPLIMQAYLLTKREGEITQCVLRGWSTTEISARLHISANTVQDHLKSIFEKVDVRSRGELVARIYSQYHSSSRG